MVILAACNKEIVDTGMTLDADELVSSAKGEEMTVNVTSYQDVTARTNADWIRTSVMRERGGRQTVMIRTLKNMEGNKRSSVVRISNGTMSSSVTVIQTSGDMILMTENGKTVFIAEAGKERKIKLVMTSEEMSGCTAKVSGPEGVNASIRMTGEMEAELTVKTALPTAEVEVTATNQVDQETVRITFVTSLEDDHGDVVLGWKRRMSIEMPDMAREFQIKSQDSWLNISKDNDNLYLNPHENTSDIRKTRLILEDSQGYQATLCTVTQLTDQYAWMADRNVMAMMVQKADEDNDGYIHVTEARKVESIDLSGTQVKSLEGLESFRNIRRLDISDTGLDFADLSEDFKFLGEIILDDDTDADVTGCRMIINMSNPEGEKYLGNITAFENQIVRPHSTNSRTTYVTDPYRSTDFSLDGQKVYIQKATLPSKNTYTVQMELLGLTDKDIETGVMDEIAREACEHIFSKEPMKSFREYFDVLYTIAVYWKRPAKDDDCDAFQMRPEGPVYERFDEIIHVSYYDWTNFCIEVSSVGFRSSEFSTCYPTRKQQNNKWLEPNRTNNLFNHEFVGHRFGNLVDEYLESEGHFDHTYKNETNVTSTIYLRKQYEDWQELAKYPEYYEELTTLYEGTAHYSTGLYCTARYLLMGYEIIDEFSAICRYRIWSEIQNIIGNEYSNVMEKVKAFVEYDKRNLWINEEVKSLNEAFKEQTIRMITD